MSDEVLADTRRDDCKCEDREHMEQRRLPVLEAGMPVRELITLGSGCSGSAVLNKDGTTMDKSALWNQRPGWVCPRLIEVRKRYGK